MSTKELERIIPYRTTIQIQMESDILLSGLITESSFQVFET